MPKVKFVGAKSHGIQNGYYDKNVGFLDNTPDLFTVLKGRKEYIVECSGNIRKQLEALPNDSALYQKMSVVKKYLDDNNISWEEVGEPSKI